MSANAAIHSKCAVRRLPTTTEGSPRNTQMVFRSNPPPFNTYSTEEHADEHPRL